MPSQEDYYYDVITIAQAGRPHPSYNHRNSYLGKFRNYPVNTDRMKSLAESPLKFRVNTSTVESTRAQWSHYHCTPD